MVYKYLTSHVPLNQGEEQSIQRIGRFSFWIACCAFFMLSSCALFELLSVKSFLAASSEDTDGFEIMFPVFKAFAYARIGTSYCQV